MVAFDGKDLVTNFTAVDKLSITWDLVLVEVGPTGNFSNFSVFSKFSHVRYACRQIELFLC